MLIEPSVLSGRLAAVEERRVAWLAGIILRGPSSSPFEDEHFQALLGSAARGDCAPKAAADDDGIECLTHASRTWRRILIRLRCRGNELTNDN
jgi:hypothetical protein